MPRPHRPLGAVVRALSLLATILVALAGLSAPRAFAEGSASLLQSGGSRPFLEFRDDVTAGSTVPRKTLVQVYAVPGDTILLGSSANGVGRGAIRWRSPDGHSGTAPTTIGVIANRAREVAGPLPNLGGYAPYRLLVPPGQGGIWEVSFVSPDSTSRSDPPELLVTAAWTQPAGVGYVCAWDVTVRNSSGFVIPGRAYTTQLAMNMGGLNATLSSEVYVLTRDGFRYRVDANGGQPFGFNWFANNKGFTDAAGTPLYKSVPLAGSHVHDPNSPDTPSDVTHKIFFNTPALDMPSTAPTPNGPTWLLLPAPLVPQVSNLTFTGVDGTLNQAGSGLGGTFKFTSTGNGNFSIRIDIDANGSYTDAVDRQLAGTAVTGTNTIFWDGLDGLGQRAGRSGNPSNVQAQVILQGGEIHFPYIDAESNIDGIVLERQNGANAPDYNVYYDDRALGGTAALPPKGENSQAGGHKWARLFGDVRGMDTWTYVPGANVQIKLAIVIRDADLELLSKTHTPQPVLAGQPVQWTVIARNNGPDSVFAATVLDTIDARVTGLSVVNTSHGGGTITSAAFTGPVFRAQFDLPPAGTATFVLSGTVGAAVTGALPNHAVALRGPDQGDPDDPTRTGAGNNGKRDTATVILPAPDLALTKTHAGSVFTVGSASTWTFGVRNGGTGSTTGPVVVRDTLPAGITYASGSGANWTFAAGAGGVVTATWTGAPIAPAANASFAITVQVDTLAVPSVVNHATVSTPGDTNPLNDRASDRVLVSSQADLALAKTHALPFTVGQNGVYTLTVTNGGPSATSRGFTVVDTLPAGLAYVTASGQNWLFAVNGRIVIATYTQALASGATASFNITVLPDGSAYPSVTNFASVFGPNDPNPANDRASDPTPVAGFPDLTIDKRHAQDFVAPGTGTYTIVVTNVGTRPSVGGWSVADTLPAFVEPVSATGSGFTFQIAGQVLTAASNVVLAPGDSARFDLLVRALPGAVPGVTNTASVSGGGDGNPFNDLDSDPTRILGTPDVSLRKSHPAPFTVGLPGTYRLDVTNVGTVATTGAITIRDTLPAGLTFASGSGGGWTFATAGSVVIMTSNAPLAPQTGVFCTIVVDVAAAAVPGTTNNATASTPGDVVPGNDRSTDPTPVNGVPNLTLDKSHTGSFTAGTNGSWSFLVRNAGSGPTIGTFDVQDTLPAGTTFVSGNGNGWVFSNIGNIVTAGFNGTLAAGGSTSFTLTVAVGPAAYPSVTNFATVEGGGDSDPGDNRAQDTVPVLGAPNLTIDKRHTEAFIAPGAGHYTFVVSNIGNLPTTGAFTVADTLPAGLLPIAGVTGAGWMYAASGSIVTLTHAGALAPGDSTIASIAVQVLPAAVPAVANAASVAGGGDRTPDDDRDVDPTAIQGTPDLALTKRHSGSFTVGLPGTYRFDVQNVGTAATSGVVTIRDTLPTGLTFVSGAGVGWTFTNTGQVVTMTSSAAITPQGSAFCTIVVSVALAATPSVTNAATIETPGDANPANDHASDPTAVGALPDLSLTKSHVGDFAVGHTGQYRFVVRNVGQGPTLGQIAIVDTLPAGITFDTPQVITGPWRGTLNPPVFNATTQQVLAAGDSLVLTFVVRVGEAAIPLAVNTASVSTVGDPNDGNDRAFDRAAVAFRKSLVVDKSASPTEVEIGDVVDYTVRMRNDGDVSFPDVRLDDRIPAGFVYVRGSARLDGAPFADPAGAPGPQLAFAIDTVRAGVTRLLTYRLAVGAGTAIGRSANVAVATSPGGPITSPPAVASVEVRGGLFASEGIIAGKLYADCDCDSNRVQGPEELGIPGVRITLEDGTSAITDAEGKYHFANVRPRLHVLRVDRTTLPPGAKLVPLSNRNAGDGLSQFVDLHAGELFRADFADGSRDTSVLRIVKQRRERGEVTSALHESPEGSGYLSAIPTRDDAHELLLRVPDRAPADPMSVLGVWAAGDSAHRATPTRVTYETDAGLWVNPQTVMPPAHDADPVAPGLQRLLPAGATFADATALMTLPETPGDVHVRITDDAGRSDSATVHVTPAPRGFFLAGLAEARLDLRSKRDGALGGMVRDGFMDRLRDASFDSDSGKVHGAARGALYGTGSVGKAGLLTLRYDSEADPSRRLFRDIRPGEGYDVFGDASLTEFAAQSRSRLYARLDHDLSYAMFGDLTTPGSGTRQLGAFSRSLNGGAVHLESRTATLGGFASRGRAHQVLDERAGLGLSGPYALSRTDGVQGSERVEILTRDRNQPSRILRTEPQTRFADYTLEPFTGRLWFRRPIPSVDADLNPVSVRVTYETEGGTADYWVAGGDAGLDLGHALHVGAALSRDDDPAHARDLASVDATLTPLRGVTLTGEFARTDTARGGLDHADHDAIRGALDVTRDAFTARAWAMRADRAFDNASSGLASGREELGGSARVRLYTGGSAFATALRSRDLVSGGRRDGLDAGLSQKLTRWLTAEAAYRTSEETTVPSNATAPVPTSNETHSLRGRLTADVPGLKRATAFGEFEQDIDHDTQRRGAFGAELPVAPRTRLYVRHENIASFGGPFALNGHQQQATTVFGIASDELREGHVFTEYRARDAFSGRDAQAAFGLRNRWSVAKGLRLDGSFERLSVLRTGTAIPVAGSGEATTAITGGIEWTGDPLWKATSRLEWRRGGGHEQWMSSAGLARKLSRDWSALGEGHWLEAPGGGTIDALGRIGVAYRQTDDNRLNWLARYEVGRRRADAVVLGNAADDRVTHVISTHANWQPTLPWTLDGQLAARWLRQSSNALLTRTDAQLAGGRARWEFRHGWDAGLDARGMFSRHFGEKQFGTGLELGHTLGRDVRAAVGFNVFGFRSDGLAGDDVTDAGPFLHLGWKFGETLFGVPANGGEAK